MRAIYTLNLILFCVVTLWGQNGHIYVSDFELDNLHNESKILNIEFDKAGITYVASRKGISRFDGNTWSGLENVPNNITSIKYDTASNVIYVGLKNGVGVLTKGENGVFVFEKLKTTPKNSEAFEDIAIGSEYVYFFSKTTIYGLRKTDHSEILEIEAKKNREFTGMIIRKGQVYVNINQLGFHKINGDKLKAISTNSDLKSSEILFATSFNRKSILFGTNKNKIYLFDGKRFVQFARHTEIHDFLNENLLWAGVDVSSKYFAVTTLTGGCAIIDKSYGKIVSVINYQTGLPDDEIYAIGKDLNGGIWLSHEQGISRCDPEFPLRNFSTYPGLSGNINDVILKGRTLYAATNKGVFYLEKANYASVSEKAKKGRSKSQANNIKGIGDIKKRRAYIQQSITHAFKKVKSLKEKCKGVYPFERNLIALTNYGLYEISADRAKPILTNIYPNDISVDKKNKRIYVAALDGVYTLGYEEIKGGEFHQWTSKRVLRQIGSQVYSIALDKSNNLFLGLDSEVMTCTLTPDLNFENLRSLTLPEPTDEQINLVQNTGSVYFIQSTGIYVYNPQKDQVLYHDIRSITSKDLQYIKGKNHAWIKEGFSWEPVIHRKVKNQSAILSIMNNLRNIYTGNSGELWIITGDNNLLRIPGQDIKAFNYDFNVEINMLTDNTDSAYTLKNPVIPYFNNALKFELAAPFYLRPEFVQYQFKIEGLRNYDEWSDWSTNPNIELSSIKAGKYTLAVRARNIVEQRSDEKNLNFKILKPFWQTQTFFIIAILTFLALVGLVFYITHRSLLRKKRLLEQRVRERTIQLQEEKDKTESLLLNILPKETAEELKKYNKVAPRNYENVTVLFTDFKGFTHIAEKLSPEELVNEIDLCFKEFDAIISKYRIEKIKTIGDAYMCAGGLPTKFKNNAFEVVKAALDIREYMEKYKAERIEKNLPFFEIRIGVHTGKVVAGVVGTRKYAYDIWGDTVNLASRMESSGEPGKVNVSGDTYQIVKAKFNCTHRGKVAAKNKGEVDMYFVDNRKTNTGTRTTKKTKS